MESKGAGLRVFGIDSAGVFDEYERQSFEEEYTESILEDWLESNPDGIGEEGSVLIIGRQVATDLGRFIDLLGLDREGNVVVVELKRGRTPRDSIAQALEYGAFAGKLDVDGLESALRSYEGDETVSLVDRHRHFFGLGDDEGVAFNKSQHLVIVGEQVTAPLRQAATFLSSGGIRTTCVEFTFFEAGDGKRLFTREVVAGGEQGRRPVVSAPQRATTERAFLDACDEHGRAVFPRVLDWARKNTHSVRWGTKGFSVGRDGGDGRVVLCYGYPRGTSYGQSIHTALRDRYGLGKTAMEVEAIDGIQSKAEAMGCFVQAGRELKWLIEAPASEEQVGSLLSWLDVVSDAIRRQEPDG